ncbi:unnamed protein product, partial [Amoebophrya sp. A120]
KDDHVAKQFGGKISLDSFTKVYQDMRNFYLQKQGLFGSEDTKTLAIALID